MTASRCFNLFCLSVIALFADAANGRAARARAELITTDIDRSEWGSYKTLLVDMRTGDYTVTAFPIGDGRTKRPAPPPEHGRLSAAKLREIRPAYRTALAQGLIDAPCDRDPRRNHLVTGNAGAPRLTMRVNGRRYDAARSFQCWTPAAHALDRRLDDGVAPVVDRMNARARLDARFRPLSRLNATAR